ncbi:MAG: hypothetical protein WC728_02255 [Elusimicrobiota bacterium]
MERNRKPPVPKAAPTPFAVVPPLASPFTSGFRSSKYRDAALVIAGFSALLLAPMVELLIMSPQGDRGTLTSGLNFRGEGLSDTSVFDDGVSGVAPGGPNISPLNASDPTSLILRFLDGKEEEPEPQPEPRPPRKPEPTGWKNALSAAAKRGVARGVASVRRSTPAGRLAKGLSGFSSGSQSGSSASAILSLPPPSRDGILPSRNDERSNLSRMRVSTDFREPWRSGTGGAGGAASGGFLQNGKILQSPGGGISQDNTQIPGVNSSALSGQSSAAGGDLSRGGEAERISLTSAKDGRNISIAEKKEDLSYQRRKMEMQEAIKLKWEKRKYDEIERKKMLEQIAAQTASQALLKVLDKLLEGKKDEGGGG